MALSRKPLTTYSRRSRARTTGKNRAQQSSPLEQLPADQEDVTMTEMTRRMQKRSRRTASTTDDDPHTGDELQIVKRAKNDAAKDSGDDEPSPALLVAPPALRAHTVGQIPSQLQAPEILFCTPHPSFCSEDAMIPSSAARSVRSDKEEFSPLPAARRMLFRTSSRNLKENCDRALGSPFSSRPGSRAASPSAAMMKGRIRKPSHHVKSRTLSAPLDPARLAHAAHGLLATAADNVAGGHLAIQAKQEKHGNSLHHRTGSYPTASSVQVVDDWLAHPTVLPLGGGAILEPSPDHASFFLDAPNESSTPPRKRRATTGGMRIETQDYDITLSGMLPDSGAYTQSSSRPSSPEVSGLPRRPPLRMRRRTVNNPSGGSLFSSVLDFSGSAADEQRASYALDIHGADCHQRASSHISTHENQTSIATAFSALNAGLASAFTPAIDAGQPALGHSLHRSASLPTLHASPVSAKSRNVTDETLLVGLGDLDSPDTQLRDLFVTLGLEDDEKAEGVSATARTSEDLADHEHASLSSASLHPNPRAPRTRQQTHRRQRADTIRASDFMVPFAADKGASGTTAQEQLVNQELTIVTHDVSGVTRRTRSGTVTLASVAASKAAATRRAAERPSGSIGHEHASPLRVHKRSNAGWPTIQMKTNDEPLRLAPGDDEDDELLLKRGSSID